MPSQKLPLPAFEPMPLARLSVPFDHPDWIFELKYDGFRALAYVESGKSRLVSRNGNTFKQFGDLASTIGAAVSGDAILDGEIVCLDDKGKPQFFDLMKRRPAWFCAFDLLWCAGQDLRGLPLLERKARLREVASPPIVYVQHIETAGVDLYASVCREDMEGIVAKLKTGAYRPEATTWVKIKNRAYTQAEGRGEFFDGRHANRQLSAAASAAFMDR